MLGLAVIVVVVQMFVVGAHDVMHTAAVAPSLVLRGQLICILQK